MNKKGVMDQLGALGVGVASLVIVLAVVFLVLANVGTQAAGLDGVPTSVYGTNCTSNACNATIQLQTATATIPGWVPLIILVSIGGLILFLVAKFGKR